jgi:hypothetical protein
MQCLSAALFVDAIEHTAATESKQPMFQLRRTEMALFDDGDGPMFFGLGITSRLVRDSRRVDGRAG